MNNAYLIAFIVYIPALNGYVSIESGDIMIEFDQVINNVTIFHKIFDIIRIVDPVKKEVLYMKKNMDLDAVKNASCFSLWANGKVCDNCISMRALAENDIYVKFELSESRLYMITAYPLDVPFSGYVVEIAKDVTSTEIIEGMERRPMIDLYSRVENKNRLFITDSLTNLFNQRYVAERLPFEMMNNSLKGYESALLLIDIDHFKNIKDIFGESTEEKILKEFSKTLLDCIREDYDWAARMHRSEFLIYLKNIHYGNLSGVCEKILSKVETTQFKYGRKVIPITVSIGASHFNSKYVASYEDLIRSTTKLLTLAKEKGRNTYISKEISQK